MKALNRRRAIKMVQKKKGLIDEMRQTLPTFVKGKNDNNIKEIVRFFDYISKYHDQNPFSEIIDFCKKKGLMNESFYEPLETLSRHFENAGRCSGGWNRTEKGETVTPDKVYLGDVYGLWTYSAAEWLSKEAELKQEFHTAASTNPDNPVTVWDIINDYQCRRFIDSHVKPMIEQLSKVA